MKKVYSKRAGKEVFALAPEQLEVFKQAGYETPAAEAVIADAGAVMLTPPEGKRAYVVFDFKKGEFFVRVKTCTLKGDELGALCGEIVQAGITKRLAENADPDRPKAAPAQTAGATSPLAALLTEALKKAVGGAFAPPSTPPAPAAEAEEVKE